MADRREARGLRPSLLDRLVQDPHEGVGLPSGRRSLSEDEYRQRVLRDIGWLFSTPNLEAQVDLSDYPRVRASVLNYGIPTATGVTYTKEGQRHLWSALAVALQRFEPRISWPGVAPEPETATLDDSHETPRFVFTVALRADPAPPLSLRLMPRVDTDIGQVMLDRERKGREG